MVAGCDQLRQEQLTLYLVNSQISEVQIIIIIGRTVSGAQAVAYSSAFQTVRLGMESRPDYPRAAPPYSLITASAIWQSVLV